ncbi:hypothetical protein ACFYVL_28335 [Streptomyces sp. NPDC004111]|uniref:hypothetical protein n=1 Tax=Streptomyces sp. NPDC004111 TaxID=3364690 RepID=UPI0036AE8D3B
MSRWSTDRLALGCATAGALVLLTTGCGTAIVADDPLPEPRTEAPGKPGTAPPCPSPGLSSARGTAGANTPGANALVAALGLREREGAPYTTYADIFSKVIVDHPRGRVALCVTDPVRGEAWVAAAGKAHPGVDTTRVDLYRGRYARHETQAARERLRDWASYPFPIHVVAVDDAGLRVTTSPAGARSKEFREQLTKDAGLAVRVEAGEPVLPLTGDRPRPPRG